MTKLTEFLAPENIRQGVMLSSKKRALEIIGKIIAEHLNSNTQNNESGDCSEEHEVCAIECFGNLFKREKLGSTALNSGVALPHAKLPTNPYIQLEKPIAVFLQLENAIDYEAADHKDVDLIYAVMFPEGSCEQYKGILPQIAQKLVDKQLLKQLRAAENTEEIWQLFEYADRLENV